MTVKDVRKDAETLSMTVTAEFDATPDRVWELWANPRKLEKWWGPPTLPATFVDHDLQPGGVCSYYMTGPEGEKAAGWWRITAVEPGRRLELVDGFSDDSGAPNPDMPTMQMTMTLDDRAGGGTRMVTTTVFPSLEAMQQLTEMGMEEGMREAMGQMDALLAA